MSKHMHHGRHNNHRHGGHHHKKHHHPKHHAKKHHHSIHHKRHGMQNRMELLAGVAILGGVGIMYMTTRR